MINKKYDKYKKYPIIIEIKSNRNGWTRVQFLHYKPNGKMLIMLKDGQKVTRHIKHVRWGKTNRYIGFDSTSGGEFKWQQEKENLKSGLRKPLKIQGPLQSGESQKAMEA